MFTTKTTQQEQSNISSTIIGNGTTISGNIETKGDVRIDGTLKGNVISHAKVLIGPMGKVDGDIDCRKADIMGHVTGNMKVSELLQLKGKATITGNLNCTKLIIESTVNFNGNCHMGASVVELNAEKQLAINE